MKSKLLYIACTFSLTQLLDVAAAGGFVPSEGHEEKKAGSLHPQAQGGKHPMKDNVEWERCL